MLLIPLLDPAGVGAWLTLSATSREIDCKPKIRSKHRVVSIYAIKRIKFTCEFPRATNPVFKSILISKGLFVQIYGVYQKKLYPLIFKLSASYCIKLTAMNASN